MTHAISTPACAHTNPTPPVIHLWDRSKSTGTHHRGYCGTPKRIAKTMLLYATFDDVQQAHRNSQGLLLCMDCANEQSARVHAARVQRRRVEAANKFQLRRTELIYQIIDEHTIGGNTAHLLDELVRLEAEEGYETQEAAK